MGEIADMLVDQMIEQGMWRTHRPVPKCRRCGSTDVYWDNSGKKPRLCEWGGQGELHQCAPTIDGLENLDA